MRRLALSLVALCGLAVMAACSGGSGLSPNGNVTPDTIFFTGNSGQVNDFFVSPTGGAPVSVTAYAAKGTGTGSTIVPNATFTWSAGYAPAGTKYYKGGSPNGNGTCGAPSTTPAPGVNSLLQQLGTGNPFPLFLGYTQLAEKPGSNPPQYTQQATQIYVGPPTVPPPGADPDTATLTVVPFAEGSTNYCVVVSATYPPTGLTRGVIVVVSDSP
jgi:hypothetical protein